ncbi:SDR family NAD(P)-dependent oxidoreductase [Teredinibacter turnerae]|uniref:SDR family NAD(P)-dependent oxidoreductase n=1 Tax=Teredinibacter turnerae TaxID=2426 RepID=UPI00037982C0|nr:SDR family oxidoreductase [Teredinibacter turnerae]
MNSRKIALVTGGSRGLGKNAALALARQGVDVIITYFNNEKAANAVVAEITATGAKAACLQLNIRDTQDLPHFADEIRTLLQTQWQQDSFDYLLNNGGSGLHKPFTEVTEADFDKMMQEHLKGVFFLTQAMLPLLSDGGSIVNISSGLTRFCVPGYATYATFKAAGETLTRYLAKELGARGIRVNSFAPGAIATDFGGGAVRDNADLNTYLASQTALGRVGEADDIGKAIAALFSDANSWVTGQRVEASGGMFL